MYWVIHIWDNGKKKMEITIMGYRRYRIWGVWGSYYSIGNFRNGLRVLGLGFKA